MYTAVQIIYWVAGFMVLAEALNKLERTDPCTAGLSTHERVVQWLKALAWGLLALGAFSAVALPVLPMLGIHVSYQFEAAIHQLSSILVMLGFAVLIVRTRVKEG